MTLKSAVFAISIISALVMPLSAANLLVNGSFETNAGGACTPGPPLNFVDLAAGSNCITGWTIVSGTVDYIDSAGWQAQNGNISIDMGGINNGAIAQTFATISGATYDVTFWMAGNMGAAPTVKTMQVSADGQSQNYSFDTTGKTFTNMGYIQETFHFVATGTSATLQFLNTDNPSSAGGPVLDNVTAAQAPEPGSFALMLIALGGMAIFMIANRFFPRSRVALVP